MNLSLPILERWFTDKNYTVTSKVTQDVAKLVAFEKSTQALAENIGQICFAGTANADSTDPATMIISGEDYLIIQRITPETALQEAYLAYEFYYSWESSLYQKMIGSTSLQELLDLTYTIFNRPMSICNSRGWDYAMTGGEGPYIHPPRETFSSENIGDSETVSDRRTFLESLTDLNPVVTFSESHDSNVLFANIWLDGERAGAILVYEADNPFTIVDKQLMTVFQNILTIYATINKGVLRSRSALSEYLIDQLENGVSRNNISINKILKYPNWKQDDSYIVLIVSSRKPSDSIFINRLCDEMDSAPFKPQAFIYNNCVIALINLKNSMGRNALLKDISALVNPQQFFWGLSHEFTGITNFTTYYAQAVLAQKEAESCGVAGKTMRDIADLLIQKEAAASPQISKYIHPDVPYLIRYDRQNHTLYAITLYWYLFYSCNYTDAANQLHLHRNTLIYRVSRIEQLISANLADINERQLLLLSLLLLKNQLTTEKFPIY